MTTHTFYAFIVVYHREFISFSYRYRLYWLPDVSSSDDIVTQSDSLWTPDLEVVMDNLTTAEFEDDLDLKEFLPAYNPLETKDPYAVLLIGTPAFPRFLYIEMCYLNN